MGANTVAHSHQIKDGPRSGKIIIDSSLEEATDRPANWKKPRNNSPLEETTDRLTDLKPGYRRDHLKE
jgi:hypothetical protein